MRRFLLLLVLFLPVAGAQGEAALDTPGSAALEGRIEARLEDAAWWGGPGDALEIDAASARGFVFGSHAVSDGRAARIVVHKWEMPLQAEGVRLRIAAGGLLVAQAEEGDLRGERLAVGITPEARRASMQDVRRELPLDFSVPAGRFVLPVAPLAAPSAYLVLAGGTFEGTWRGQVGRINEGALVNITYLVLELTDVRLHPSGGDLYAAGFLADVAGRASFPAASGVLRQGGEWSLNRQPLEVEGEFRVTGFPREAPPPVVRALAAPGGEARYVVEGNFRSASVAGQELFRLAGPGAAASLALGALVAWLYWRMGDREVTLHPARAALFSLIQSSPGIQQGRAAEELNLSGGALQHHLRVLERAKLIRVQRAGRFRLLYPRGHAPTLRADLEPRGRALAVYDCLISRPGATARDVAEAVGITRQLATHHLASLHRAGLARREGDSPARWYA